FFFQAEDGIRDFHVTGVQTCALPIFAPKMMFASAAAELATSCAASLISNRPRSEPPWIDSSTPWAPSMLASSSGEEIAISAAARSEERRVGKECRPRWLRHPLMQYAA